MPLFQYSTPVYERSCHTLYISMLKNTSRNNKTAHGWSTKKKCAVHKGHTMKSNGLGFSSEQRPSSSTQKNKSAPAIEIQIESTSSTSGTRLLAMPSTSTALCCILTTLLVAAGVGIGIWFAMTPVITSSNATSS